MNTSKQYIKKVISIDNNSTPDARGKRLRKIRNLANLSREELAASCQIHPHTLKRWELGYFGGLPLDGAQIIIKRAADEGVVCSLDWLLYKIGTGPQLIPDYDNFKNLESPAKLAIHHTEDEQKIISEILLFRKNYRNTIDHKIDDDALFPNYNIGDYVSGIIYPLEKLKPLIGQNCIICLKNGKIITRNLRPGNKKHSYTLVATNPNTSVACPVLHNIEIEYVAPILRHYIKINGL